MKISKVDVMGQELERWTHKSCVADFATEKDWATLYSIESKIRRKGHATELLVTAKRYYEGQGKTFGGTVALNSGMKRIYQRLKIKEYE